MKELYPHARCAFGNVFWNIGCLLNGDNELVGNCWARNLLTPSIQKSILNNCRLIHLLLLRLMYVPIEIIVYSNVAYISNILYPIPLTQRGQFFWFTESAWKFQYLIEPTVLNRNCNFFYKTCLLVLRSGLRGDSKCCHKSSPVSDFAWFIPPCQGLDRIVQKTFATSSVSLMSFGKVWIRFQIMFYFFAAQAALSLPLSLRDWFTIDYSEWSTWWCYMITSNILPMQVKGY